VSIDLQSGHTVSVVAPSEALRLPAGSWSPSIPKKCPACGQGPLFPGFHGLFQLVPFAATTTSNIHPVISHPTSPSSWFST